MYKELFQVPVIKKNNGFTALRLICALIVVYEHFVVLTNYQLPILNLRSFVVNTFFILSGFWVTKSLFSSDSIIEFYKKRVKKIFPLYLLVIFLSAFFLFFFSTLSLKEYFFNKIFWKYLLFNILTINFIQPYLPGVFDNAPVNGSLWTIKVELGFYIILPIIIILWLGKNNKSKSNNNDEKNISMKYNWIVLFLLYLLSFLFVIIINICIEKYHLPEAINHQLPTYMTYFISGMVCLLYYDKIFDALNFLSVPSIIILILFRYIDNYFINTFLMIFEPLALAFFIMFLAFKVKPLQLLSKLYDFSYPLYLFHYPLIMLLKFYI